jgi:hypothetical protein
MSADWWARGIAIGGAAAASFSMITSYRTYRRVTPKVSLAVDDKGSDRHALALRIANKSSTPVLLERVELRRMWKNPVRRYLIDKPSPSVLKEFYEPLRIGPFSGTKFPGACTTPSPRRPPASAPRCAPGRWPAESRYC